MINFLGQCVQNLIKTLKYIIDGRTKFSSVITQAAMISYDSLSISLTIVFIVCCGNIFADIKTVPYERCGELCWWFYCCCSCS